MIDAIDSLLDKMDLFLETFGGSFQWFLWMCGGMAAFGILLLIILLGTRAKLNRVIRQQHSQQELTRQLLEAQLRQNRLLAESMGKEMDPADAPGQHSSSLRDQY
jgi:hypothetical protein